MVKDSTNGRGWIELILQEKMGWTDYANGRWRVELILEKKAGWTDSA